MHEFPGLVYFERTAGRITAGDGLLVRPGELVEIRDPDDLVAARGWGLFFLPDAAATGTPWPGV